MCKVCEVLRCCVSGGWHLKCREVPLNRQNNTYVRDRKNLKIFHIWCQSISVMFDHRTYTEWRTASPLLLPWQSTSSAWSDISVNQWIQCAGTRLTYLLNSSCLVKGSAARHDSQQDKRPSKQSLSFNRSFWVDSYSKGNASTFRRAIFGRRNSSVVVSCMDRVGLYFN